MILTEVLLLLLAALKGSVLEVAKGSAEDCLKKQSDANGSEPLKGSPPNGSKKTKHKHKTPKNITILSVLSPEGMITAVIKTFLGLAL